MGFLEDLYTSADEWELEYNILKKDIKNISMNAIYQNDGLLIHNIKLNLELLEKTYYKLDKLYTYSVVGYDLNVKNPESNNRIQRIELLYNYIDEKSKSFNESIKKHKIEFLNLLLNDSELKNTVYIIMDFWKITF